MPAAFMTSETLAYADRKSTERVQLRIADVAGRTPLGESAVWTATSFLGVRSWGRVHVIRSYGQHIPCREIIYTEEDLVPGSLHYHAVICRGIEGWRWAVSEPATERWHGFQ